MEIEDSECPKDKFPLQQTSSIFFDLIFFFFFVAATPFIFFCLCNSYASYHELVSMFNERVYNNMNMYLLRLGHLSNSTKSIRLFGWEWTNGADEQLHLWDVCVCLLTKQHNRSSPLSSLTSSMHQNLFMFRHIILYILLLMVTLIQVASLLCLSTITFFSLKTKQVQSTFRGFCSAENHCYSCHG